LSKDLFTRKRIKISELSFNTGQVPGLPKNPRFIRDQKFEAMCQSIREDPEYLEVREVLIYDYQGVNVVIAGEMRTRGAKHEGHKEVPCKVFPESTPIEKIRAYAIKDNAHYGEWDQDSLANDWEAGELKEWGVDEASWGEVNEEQVLPEGDDLIGEKKGLPPTLKITFEDVEHLQQAEIEVIEILQRYKGSFYSLSCGEV